MANHLKLALVLTTALMSVCFAYYNDIKDSYVPDDFLRELLEAMQPQDEYDDDSLPLTDSQLGYLNRAQKDQTERLMDYDSILERTNPHPSLRDEEHMQHSSMWGQSQYQLMSGGAGEGPHVLKPQVKTDATLPAYCNPPNPCPVGYTEDQGCTNDFENTASFSREYQGAQDCMCDTEHMFECPAASPEQISSQQQSFGNYFQSVAKFPAEHKNMVAKKFWVKKASNPPRNPYLEGPKLPVAAKKGFKVY